MELLIAPCVLELNLLLNQPNLPLNLLNLLLNLLNLRLNPHNLLLQVLVHLPPTVRLPIAGLIPTSNVLSVTVVTGLIPLSRVQPVQLVRLVFTCLGLVRDILIQCAPLVTLMLVILAKLDGLKIYTESVFLNCA